jgi:glycosyltransferase involved in cell wall biosynthesis
LKPVVTIGLVVKNNEGTIREAVDGIVSQVFPHELMEVIVVDGHSEDNTLSILKTMFLKNEIKTKFFSETKGLGFARQIVVDNAIGKYILWVDGDIILTHNYIKKQLQVMNENRKVGITAGVLGLLPGNLVLTLELIPSIIDHKRYGQPKSFIWKTTKFPATAGAFFRTEAVRIVKGFDIELKGSGEDWDVTQRINDIGWKIRRNNAIFYERHDDMSTIIDLLRKYLWYGYTIQSLYQKNSNTFPISRMSPPAGFVSGFFYSLIAYKLLHKKIVFLLPIHFALKMSAWFFGFFKSQTKCKKLVN